MERRYPAQYMVAGCELGQMLIPVYMATNGNPCKDCNCHDSCPAYREFNLTDFNRPQKQTSDLVCPKCKSPVNIKKAKRRCWTQRGIEGMLCACGHEF